MKKRHTSFWALLSLAAALTHGVNAHAEIADPGWPRTFAQGDNQLTVYQPQVDYWKDYTYLHFRCAIALKTARNQEDVFGVAEITAMTKADHTTRTVWLTATKRDLRFPGRSEDEVKVLRAIVDDIRPMSAVITISLDRVLAYLNPDEQPQQRSVQVELAPPEIFFRGRPAILVMFLGEPQFKPVVKGRTDLMFAVNTNWDLFLDSGSRRYFLLHQNTWLSAADVKGPWTAASRLPQALSALPDDDNWGHVKQSLPGRRAGSLPEVIVSTRPAELILTEGDPKYQPIPGTRLMRVVNTESLLFLNTADAHYYFLAAGRWFRAEKPGGAWSAASTDLPAEFGRIPDDDPAAFIKASVPGTQEAKDAVLLASVPSMTVVHVTNTTVQVVYSGQPQFKPVEGVTTVQYVVNSPQAVFLVGGRYYCCDQGVWFESAAATGPWAFCKKIPAEIYSIPPSNPHHNVTYVVVQESTPTTVVYSQTAGYSGEYVAASGVVMFGAGILLGAVIADSDDVAVYYGYPRPAYYSYGCGAVYHYGYGGYYRTAHVSYGPYGGAGRAAAYNPATGTYARGAAVYGPAGSASVRQAYNPYTGDYAQSRRVSTAAGSAGRFAATKDGTTAWGGYRSSAYGTAAGARSSEGGAAAAWDTRRGQGAVAKSSDGDYYAAKDGTVYKRDESGNWSQNTGSGWGDVSRTAPSGDRTTRSTATPTARPTAAAAARPTAAPSTTPAHPAPRSSASGITRSAPPSLEAQARSRDTGNRRSVSSQNFRSFSGGSFGGGRSSGGRGRR